MNKNSIKLKIETTSVKMQLETYSDITIINGEARSQIAKPKTFNQIKQQTVLQERNYISSANEFEI